MGQRQGLVIIGATITAFAFPPGVRADKVGFLPTPLVDHPVHHPTESRSGSRWKSSVGSWGENFAEQALRLDGFEEIHEVKTKGNQGIDRVAIKRSADGSIQEARYVEVKTSRSPKPKLGNSRYGGTQMSRLHLSENLKKMRNSGDPELRKLALELGRFRRSSRQPIQLMGEVIHVNTKTGLVTRYSGDLTTVRSVDSVDRLLRQIRQHAGNSETRRWAAQSLSEWDQIQSHSMSSYLGKSVAQQAKTVILGNPGTSTGSIEVAAARQSRVALIKRLLRRAGGPIAGVVSLAFDAKEVFDTEYEYRAGAISERQRSMRLLTTIGGAAGAFAGASAGGATGMWIGAFGGPFAFITVPSGGFAGATIFGIAGYFGGTTITQYASLAWYGSIDAAVQEKFERGWLAMSLPVD